MKRMLLLAVILVGFSVATFAQNRKPEWATIKTPSLRCWECKKRLEDYMAREIAQTESGIIKTQINLLSGTTRVQYWPDRVNLNYIQTAFANAGFDADDIKAEPDSYKKLPPACKRVEEGGGPQKGKPCHMQPF
ncbi:copper chaperone [Segetibacter sp.]|jgi:mercuric ion binding protein|uniref:copper chaperone n=1 Tax=Segetibacter sp. TaxID=2231182 RepID=UPI00261E1C6E|nr:copper chaperone [Segetibacter sp.]